MVTIRDVAKDAGVSIGTVSRAFNGYQDINDETKSKIFLVAKELGYAPNVNARSLSSKVTRNMGLIVNGFLESDRRDNFILQLLQGIYRYSFEHSLEVALYTLDSEQQKKKSYGRFCQEHSIFGAILSGVAINDPYFKELVKSGMPCVLIDVSIKGKGLGCVTVDNIKAGDEMAQYLIDHGHRRIVVVQGKKQAEVNNFRIAGIYTAFQRNGMELKREQILTCDFNEKMAYDNVRSYLQTHGRDAATAFLCLSDLMALGAMNAVRDLGYSVPEDYSVTGFDGIAITDYTTPGLTTIEQNIEEMGYRAAGLLKDLRDGIAEGQCIFLPYLFRERGSVKIITGDCK